MSLIFIAGPYTATKAKSVRKHITEARYVASQVWKTENYALCPHTNTGNFDLDFDVSETIYLRGYIEMLTRCDAVLFLPYWNTSSGTRGEMRKTLELELPFLELEQLTFTQREIQWLNKL